MQAAYLKLEAWDEELQGDHDRKFLLNGIEHGFDIIDPNAPSLFWGGCNEIKILGSQIVDYMHCFRRTPLT